MIKQYERIIKVFFVLLFLSKNDGKDIQLYEEEKETIKNNDTDWMNIFKKKEKINELNRLLIDELIEDIVLVKMVI